MGQVKHMVFCLITERGLITVRASFSRLKEHTDPGKKKNEPEHKFVAVCKLRSTKLLDRYRHKELHEGAPTVGLLPRCTLSSQRWSLLATKTFRYQELVSG